MPEVKIATLGYLAYARDPGGRVAPSVSASITDGDDACTPGRAGGG